MDEAAEHLFNRKHAAPALIAAMRKLADRNGREPKSMYQTRLGDACVPKKPTSQGRWARES
jgi:hypothetical protein